MPASTWYSVPTAVQLWTEPSMEQNPYGGGHRRGGPPEGKEPAWISGLGEDYNMFMDRFLQGVTGCVVCQWLDGACKLISPLCQELVITSGMASMIF